MEYIGLTGDANGMDTTVITEVADYFRNRLRARIPANYPFAGSDFNTTRVGIHADGVLKGPEIYSIFDTEKILNKPIDISISDKSGLAGIACWVNNHLGLEGVKMIDKRHPGVVRINEWVDAQYARGRMTGISSEEMLLQARKFLPDLFESDLDKLKTKARDIASHFVEAIAETPQMRSMDTAQLEPVMQDILEENPFVQLVYMTDLDGIMIRNMARPADRARYKAMGEDDDFSDRPWFIGPLKDGKVFVTDFYTSKYTGALCITVSAPIRNAREEIAGIMGVDLRFEELVKLVEQD